MKKQISYLLTVLCLFAVNKAFADPMAGTTFPASAQASLGGYNPGAYNTT